MDDVVAARDRLLGMDDRELDRLCRPRDVRVLTLFGSAADATVVEPGDLDVGVVFEPGAAHDVLGLLEDLVAALGTEKVDVLDAECASETARRRAIADGRPLYESEPTAYAMAAMAADALFMETARMRAAALASLRS